MAISRDPNNVTSLIDGQVLINLGDNPTVGKLGKIDATWHTLGIMPEDLNQPLTRTVDKEEVKGGGYGVVSTSYTPGAVESTVQTLEENDITRWIEFPDRVAKDGTIFERHTGKVARATVLFVKQHDNGVTELRVSRMPATLTKAEVGRGKAAEGREITISFTPDKDKVLFEHRWFKSEGGDVVEIAPKIFVDDTEITGDVGAATAQQLGGANGKAVTVELVDAPASEPSSS